MIHVQGFLCYNEMFMTEIKYLICEISVFKIDFLAQELGLYFIGGGRVVSFQFFRYMYISRSVRHLKIFN